MFAKPILEYALETEDSPIMDDLCRSLDQIVHPSGSIELAIALKEAEGCIVNRTDCMGNVTLLRASAREMRKQ